MGDKHKIKKTDLKAFFGTAEMAMDGHYHEIYDRLGWKKGRNGNYYCIEEDSHGGGKDTNPSMSVNNKNGTWHCFTCDVKGNLQKYWTEYLKGSSEWGDSFTDFLVDVAGMNSSLINFSDTKKDPDFEKNSRELRELYENIQKVKTAEKGHPWMLSGDLIKMVKDLSTIPMKDLDIWVNQLLENKKAMDYLYDTRRITEAVIRKYRIGWFEHKGISKRTGKPFSNWKYVFPVINAEGDLINIKAYDPTANDPAFKWMNPFAGHDSCPIPINNFTKQKLYFFEGEPDCYCAIAMGIEGAVTMGSKAMKNVNDVFGKERARQLFSGKEAVICMDSDAESKKIVSEIAESLYPYVKQVKIIDLDKSDINPNGLDPTKTKVVKVKGQDKVKRMEKDFTDFIKKNGFDDTSKKMFDSLVEKTEVFTINIERKRVERFKVTLQEARMSRYYSPDRSKELELIAAVSDFNCNAYMYPKEFIVTCRAMGDNNKRFNPCKQCALVEHDDIDERKRMEFKIIRGPMSDDLKEISISDHDILGLVEVTDSQKTKQLKKLCGINERCNFCIIQDSVQEKLLHVRLAKDVNDYEDEEIGDKISESTSDIDMEAYISGDNDIYQNKTYRFFGSQTTAWNGQNAVLFIHKAEPIQTSIESFRMDQETHDLLCEFKPKEGESIEDHLFRRYEVFANAAGVTGRKELFMINDLVFFSPIEIRSKMLPSIKRGWVEALIAGDPRTCKTLISKFLMRHYKVGTIVAGSSAVSRSGLIGGVAFFKNKSQISWGKMPANDMGTVIIDEMSEIDIKTLTDLTNLRSEGIANIDQIKSAKSTARVRKIMLSNAREWKDDEKREYNYGIQFLKDLCLKTRILARFDIAFYVKEGDVDINEFGNKYEEIATDFTEYQCRHLIMWAYSRKPEEIIFEDGFEDRINNLQKEMSNKYHSSTQLINQEMRAKLVRLSTSLATMLYSTPEKDWNKILVKKEHIEYIVKFLYSIYDHDNMKMDQFSVVKRNQESLGDMRFMMNISKYIDLGPIFNEEEFTDRSLHQIFYDFLDKVHSNELSIPDAKTDSILTSGMHTYEGNYKIISLLTSRNCMIRCKRGIFKKTKMFNLWLEKRIEDGERAEESYILESGPNKRNSEVIDQVKVISCSRQQSSKRKNS